MEMKKAISLIVLIVLVFLLFVGCTSYNQTNNDIETQYFDSYNKTGKDTSVGKKSCIYNGRIYYFDNMERGAGIYSMNNTGGDIRFEVKANDIRKIQFINNRIYYLDFVGYVDNENGEIRSYELYYYDLDSNTKNRVLSDRDYIYIQGSSSKSPTLWDFYITDDCIFVSYLYVGMNAKLTAGLYCKNVDPTNIECLISANSNNYDGIDVGILTLFRISKCVVTTPFGIQGNQPRNKGAEKKDTDNNEYDFAGYSSVVDAETNTKVVEADFAICADDYLLQGIIKMNYILSKGNYIFIMNKDFEVINSAYLDSGIWVKTMGFAKGNAFFIAENQEKNQSLYYLDINSLKYKLIKECERPNWSCNI